jgi:hypothetical protein
MGLWGVLSGRRRGRFCFLFGGWFGEFVDSLGWLDICSCNRFGALLRYMGGTLACDTGLGV